MQTYSQDFREIMVQALSERGMGKSEVAHLSPHIAFKPISWRTR
jgi:hypothetical protein